MLMSSHTFNLVKRSDSITIWNSDFSRNVVYEELNAASTYLALFKSGGSKQSCTRQSETSGQFRTEPTCILASQPFSYTAEIIQS